MGWDCLLTSLWRVKCVKLLEHLTHPAGLSVVLWILSPLLKLFFSHLLNLISIQIPTGNRELIIRHVYWLNDQESRPFNYHYPVTACAAITHHTSSLVSHIHLCIFLSHKAMACFSLAFGTKWSQTCKGKSRQGERESFWPENRKKLLLPLQRLPSLCLS